ncbi:MAG: hypothetical protein NZZ60_02040 [Bacteroidia bacterium]|nr:hypothetical protein [Bacteroidia bacterium]MDW8416582.1 hypothetical protein [Bacteroidia bacterium]
MNGSVPKVSLHRQAILDAVRVAEDRHTRWQSYQKPHYPNKPLTHLRGALGEIAAEKWLSEQGVDFMPCFRKQSSEKNKPDFLIYPRKAIYLNMEVKTWSAAHWLPLGRCITPKQLHILSEIKCVDILLWLVVHDEEFIQNLPANAAWEEIHQALGGVSVVDITLAGWNWLVEVNDWTLKPTGHGEEKILNYQAELSDMHDTGTLVKLLRRWPAHFHQDDTH